MQNKNAKGRLKKSHQNINGRNFSGSFLSKGRWNKRRERFFRRPLNPSVGCVPPGTHAVGWDCRENEERVRTYIPYMQATAYSQEESTNFQVTFKAIKDYSTLYVHYCILKTYHDYFKKR